MNLDLEIKVLKAKNEALESRVSMLEESVKFFMRHLNNDSKK